MTTLQNGDSFLVQRTDSQSGISTNYQVSQENLMANLADDDLLLVQRTSAGISTNYSITGSALKEDLTGVTGLIVPPVEVLTPINGAGITEFDQYEPLSSAITAVSGGGTFDRTTDEIQSVTDISNWNQSQTWSSGTYTGSQPPSSSYAVEYAFNENGEDGGSFGPGDYWAIESGEATLTFSSPITLSSNSTVEILAGNYEWIAANGGGMTFICSNGSVPVTLNAVNNAVAKTTISDAYTTFGSQITAITLTAASNGWMSLVGLFVDGKRLVDAGITGATITGKSLSFPTNTNFSGLSVGDEVQTGVSITAIDASATPPTITVDGGTWTTSDHLTGSTPYETSLTFTDTTELANMVAPLEMTDATGSNSLTPTTSNVVSTSFTPSASYFNVTTYTGDNSVNVQNFITGVDIQNNGGMIWFKSRTNGQSARILDTYGGTLSSLIPSSTAARNNLGGDGLTFNNDGFSIGWAGGDLASSNDYVAWSFREAPGFFDIVTYTGDRNQNPDGSLTISHNLGSVPAMILVKDISRSENWYIYHHNMTMAYGSAYPPEDLWIKLDLGGTASRDISNWNAAPPTSTEFTVGATSNTNHPGDEYVAYLFADNPSNQIKCGSYLGNATGGGAPAVPNQIDCGFRPKFVLIKNVESSTDWLIFDDQRGDRWLKANETDSEGFSSDAPVVFNDTGFSLPTGLHWVNQDNTEHIFMAIGEAGSPDQTEITFQDNTALSALTSGMTITSDRIPTLGSAFSTYLYVGNTDPSLTITNGIDLAGEGGLVWIKQRNGQREHHLFDTERGATKYLNTRNLSEQQTNAETLTSFTSSGFILGDDTQVNHPEDFVSWTFRKAPGFFDIRKYDGTGGTQNIPHSLGSTPGMIIIKNIDSAYHWTVWHKDLSTGQFLRINTTGGASSSYQNSHVSSVSSTDFTLGGDAEVNGNNKEYVAYIFADNPDNQIKCGKTSYLPGATTENVVCGFKPAFVMAKCISETGQWVMVDVERGLPQSPSAASYLYPNKNEQEGSSYDTMNMNANEDGFILKATNGAGEYIYIAIGSPTGMSSIPTGTLVADADPSTNTASVAATSWPTGDTVTGPSLSASLTSILEVSGNTIFGNGSTGTWIPGYYAEGSQVNDAPPGPSEITFTSQNQGTPAFSGVDATLTSRTWTLESGTTATGPWTVVDTYEDYDILNSQDGSTPWTSNKPNLSPNTFYRVKVRYDSLNAESVESVYNTFKTGDA